MQRDEGHRSEKREGSRSGEYGRDERRGEGRDQGSRRGQEREGSRSGEHGRDERRGEERDQGSRRGEERDRRK